MSKLCKKTTSKRGMVKEMKKRLTLQKVGLILGSLGKGGHYLSRKPVSKWDKYDIANWNSIIRNINMW